MIDYELRTDHITIPKNTGVQGLLRTVKELLAEIPRVKEFKFTSTGDFYYTWYAPAGADLGALHVTFEDLQPYSIIRNRHVVEVMHTSGALLLPTLLMDCQRDRLYPICFVIGTESVLFDWWRSLRGEALPDGDYLMGYPLLRDASVPDDAIILCAGWARTAQIEDTYRSYKMLLVPEENSHGK